MADGIMIDMIKCLLRKFCCSDFVSLEEVLMYHHSNTCMHVFVWGGGCGCVRTHTHFPLLFSTLFFSHSTSSRNLELNIWSRLVSQKAGGIYLSLSHLVQNFQKCIATPRHLCRCWTHVLMLTQQSLYQMSHLPSPKTN